MITFKQFLIESFKHENVLKKHLDSSLIKKIGDGAIFHYYGLPLSELEFKQLPISAFEIKFNSYFDPKEEFKSKDHYLHFPWHFTKAPKESEKPRQAASWDLMTIMANNKTGRFIIFDRLNVVIGSNLNYYGKNGFTYQEAFDQFNELVTDPSTVVFVSEVSKSEKQEMIKPYIDRVKSPALQVQGPDFRDFKLHFFKAGFDLIEMRLNNVTEDYVRVGLTFKRLKSPNEKHKDTVFNGAFDYSPYDKSFMGDDDLPGSMSSAIVNLLNRLLKDVREIQKKHGYRKDK